MAIGTSKCNHCKLDFAGSYLDWPGDGSKGYCLECQLMLAPRFIRTYAESGGR